MTRPGAVADTAELTDDAYDLVVDATGVPFVMAETVRLVRPGGEVLWFGVPNRDARIEFAPFDVFRKGISIHGSFTSVRKASRPWKCFAAGQSRSTIS